MTHQKKITNIFIVSFFFATIMLAGSCYYDKAELLYPGSDDPVNCDSIPATFNANVLPLINSKCNITGCHDGTASGGFVFQNYLQVSGAKDRIRTEVVQKTMPPTGPLLPEEINIIKCWIEGGALNN